jgi:hypothetical protein
MEKRYDVVYKFDLIIKRTQKAHAKIVLGIKCMLRFFYNVCSKGFSLR